MNFLNRLAGGNEEGNNNDGGVGGWLASIKEKSKDLMEVYKRDIGEFASVVSKDTTEAVAKTRGTLEKTLASTSNQTSAIEQTSKQSSKQTDMSKNNRLHICHMRQLVAERVQGQLQASIPSEHKAHVYE
eukprot:638005-Hanusia_phi.AAC.4